MKLVVTIDVGEKGIFNGSHNSRDVPISNVSKLTVLDPLSTVHHNFATTYRALAERLKDKPYFIGFQNVLCKRGTKAYNTDGVHLTDRGRELVAVKMSIVLKEKIF